MNVRLAACPHRLWPLLVTLLIAACSGDSPTSPSNGTPPPVTVPFSITTLQAGSGDQATTGEILSVAFTGWLYDIGAVDNKGTLFDESAAFPFVLGEDRLIEGFNRGAEGMRLGEKRRVVIPPDLAFGARGAATIPPNSTLIFEIELLSLTPVPAFETTDLVVGTGDPVDIGQTITVTFTGWIYDETAPENKGQQFEQFTSFVFILGNTFEGFNQAVVGMRVGGVRRAVIPPLLGFGSEGSNLVPGFSSLVYEITLEAVS